MRITVLFLSVPFILGVLHSVGYEVPLVPIDSYGTAQTGPEGVVAIGAGRNGGNGSVAGIGSVSGNEALSGPARSIGPGYGEAEGPSGACGLVAPKPGVFDPGNPGLSFYPATDRRDANGVDEVAVIPPGTPGTWYIDTCYSNVTFPLPVFVPGVPGTPAPPPPPSPAQLAQIAYGEIRLPAPGLQLSPSTQANPAVPQIVGAPTWAWVPSSSWAALSATASAGPVVVTATASPAMIRLSYTDGGQTSTTVCRGPGTPYSDDLAGRESPAAPLSAASPDCGWTYRHPSARAPGGRVPVTGVVTYNVTWTVTGAPGGGDLGPLNSPPTTYSVPVSEIQVLNTR